MNERTFIKFSANVAHETGNNLEHFRDVAVNPLNPESIVLFFGFATVGNMEKRANGLLWNFHEILGTIDEIIN